MYKKSVLALILTLSLSLSACQTTDLQTITDTQQVITGKPSWFVDGNKYTTTVTYETPEGEESNTFTVVLMEGVIQVVEVGIDTEVGASLKYQRDFASGVTSVVVGKKLANLQEVDVVSGASNTTSAFNEAIAGLQAQLKS